MKTIDEVKQIKKQFRNEYEDAFRLAGNNLVVGMWQDCNELYIFAYLTNDKLKNILPDEYHNVKVIVEVIGELGAL